MADCIYFVSPPESVHTMMGVTECSLESFPNNKTIRNIIADVNLV